MGDGETLVSGCVVITRTGYRRIVCDHTTLFYSFYQKWGKNSPFGNWILNTGAGLGPSSSWFCLHDERDIPVFFVIPAADTPALLAYGCRYD